MSFLTILGLPNISPSFESSDSAWTFLQSCIRESISKSLVSVPIPQHEIASKGRVQGQKGEESTWDDEVPSQQRRFRHSLRFNASPSDDPAAIPMANFGECQSKIRKGQLLGSLSVLQDPAKPTEKDFCFAEVFTGKFQTEPEPYIADSPEDVAGPEGRHFRSLGMRIQGTS